MTYHPTDFDDLRAIGLSERDALVAAAMLPHLPDDEALVRIRSDEERVPTFEKPEAVDEFKRRVPTVGGSSNLRRAKPEAPDGKDAIEEQVDLTPTPHGIKSYRVGTYDVDLLIRTDDEYDFETDQSLLSDFGVESSILTAVGATIRPYTYPRKPRFPTYTG